MAALLHPTPLVPPDPRRRSSGAFAVCLVALITGCTMVFVGLLPPNTLSHAIEVPDMGLNRVAAPRFSAVHAAGDATRNLGFVYSGPVTPYARLGADQPDRVLLEEEDEGGDLRQDLAMMAAAQHAGRWTRLDGTGAVAAQAVSLDDSQSALLTPAEEQYSSH
jgi:hypothetical protein